MSCLLEWKNYSLLTKYSDAIRGRCKVIYTPSSVSDILHRRLIAIRHWSERKTCLKHHHRQQNRYLSLVNMYHSKCANKYLVFTRILKELYHVIREYASMSLRCTTSTTTFVKICLPKRSECTHRPIPLITVSGGPKMEHALWTSIQAK